MYLFGTHTCIKALENPARVVERVFIVHKEILSKLPPIDHLKVEVISKSNLEKMLPLQAVHQGIALKVQPLKPFSISFLEQLNQPNQCVVLLDQVSDPYNVGAIMRSAAAFGAQAIILTARHSAQESAIIAKAASGALDVIPMCVINNVAQALDELKQIGFWSVGFSEHAPCSINQIDLTGKMVLVMGAEGEGLRRLTQKKCDFLAKLPTEDNFSTLNVSVAAAIALYEASQQVKIKLSKI